MNFNKLYESIMDNQIYNAKDLEENLPIIKFKSIESFIPEHFTGIGIWPDQCTVYYNDGMIHREGKPAVLWPDGSRSWFKFGLIHREDGPAVEYANGDKEWHLEGKEYSERDYKLELIRSGIIKDPSLSDVMDAI